MAPAAAPSLKPFDPYKSPAILHRDRKVEKYFQEERRARGPGRPEPPRLIRALEDEEPYKMRIMLASGEEDVNQVDHEQCTVLSHACRYGQDKTVAMLLTQDEIDVDQGNYMSATPLFFAASMGHTECVRLLLKAGADAAKGNDYGATPLHGAAIENHGEICQLLLDAGADPSARNCLGQRPLDRAKASTLPFRPHRRRSRRLVGRYAGALAPSPSPPPPPPPPHPTALAPRAQTEFKKAALAVLEKATPADEAAKPDAPDRTAELGAGAASAATA